MVNGWRRSTISSSTRSIKTVLALSPWLENQNDSNSTPILFLSGQYDNIASSHSPMNVDKLLFEVAGGNQMYVVI